MPVLVKANEATAGRRTVAFHLVQTDGITPATGEAGGQPQISVDGAAFTNTGIGTLSAIGNGRYEAAITQATVATAGTRIETRYKSASTAECPGDSVRVIGFDPYALSGESGGFPILGTNNAGIKLAPGSGKALELVSSDSNAFYIEGGFTGFGTGHAVSIVALDGDGVRSVGGQGGVGMYLEGSGGAISAPGLWLEAGTPFTGPVADDIYLDHLHSYTLAAAIWDEPATLHIAVSGSLANLVSDTVLNTVDRLLGRNLAGGSDGGRMVKDALRAIRNKVIFDIPVAGQFTVMAEDDTTPAWTGTYTRASTDVNNLIAVDPA